MAFYHEILGFSCKSSQQNQSIEILADGPHGLQDSGWLGVRRFQSFVVQLPLCTQRRPKWEPEWWDRGPKNTTKIKGGAEIPELAMVSMWFLAVLLESIGNDHINGRCAGFDYGRVTHVLNPEAWRKNRRERNATGTGEVPGSGP